MQVYLSFVQVQSNQRGGGGEAEAPQMGQHWTERVLRNVGNWSNGNTYPAVPPSLYSQVKLYIFYPSRHVQGAADQGFGGLAADTRCCAGTCTW